MLYLVGTPIGNLGDLTLRAIETLRQVDRVLAEDTRRTRGLLAHLGIQGKPVQRLDAHVEARSIDELAEELRNGRSIALVSDAGMPVVSDPGALLVRALSERNLRVLVVPGPSSVTSAVALSGLVTGSFVFLGFPPRHGEKRRAFLERVLSSQEPAVLLESANRAQATLRELAVRAPQRRAAVCRELTKLHEETRHGSLSELAEEAHWRGELTLVVEHAPADSIGPARSESALDDDALDTRIGELLSAGTPSKLVLSEIYAAYGGSRRDLYARIQAVKSRLRAACEDEKS